MNKKMTLHAEIAYVLGLVLLALGTAFMERAGFGMSMVVAPAYIVHLKVSQTFAWFSFGMAEYCLQALLLIIITIFLRRFKIMYLFSFITAVLYGFVLDLTIYLVGWIPDFGFVGQIVFFLAGMAVCAMGVAMFFQTYIAPEAYELIVKEFAEHFGGIISKVKTIYDCSSFTVAVLLSFAFFGLWHFEGVGIGTLICSLVNGFLIGRICKLIEKYCVVRDLLPTLRKVFEK